MSGSNRNEGLASLAKYGGALATLLVLVLVIWQISAQIAENRTYAERNTHHYAEATHNEVERSCATGTTAEIANCIDQIVKASEDTKRAEYDLQAQRDMSEWSFWMLLISGIGSVLTGVGIWFVNENLIEMRRQRVVSQDQVEVAKRSNFILESQVRARLSVLQADICFINNAYQATIKIKIKNYGQTTAEDVSVLYKLRVLGGADFADGDQLDGVKQQHILSQITGQEIAEGLVYLEPGDVVEGGIDKFAAADNIIFHFDCIVAFKTGLDENELKRVADVSFTSTFVAKTNDLIFTHQNAERWYPLAIVRAASAPWIQKFRVKMGGMSFVYGDNIHIKKKSYPNEN